MQPQPSNPTPATFKVSYQIPKDVLVRIWWRRMMARPRVIGAICALIVLSLVCFVAFQGTTYAGFILLLFAILVPVILYRSVAKAVDSNSQHTDPKTVEFSSTRIFVTGPDWKSEVPWTMFCGFSEDAAYFYLHLSDNGIASVVPKIAFTAESQAKFREYASCLND